MKKIMMLTSIATGVVACANAAPEPQVGVANPASEFCVKQGGQSVIRKDKTGAEYGMCVLPNGQEVEEWAYFRQYSK